MFSEGIEMEHSLKMDEKIKVPKLKCFYFEDPVHVKDLQYEICKSH